MDDFDWSMMGDFGADAGFDWSSLVDLDLDDVQLDGHDFSIEDLISSGGGLDMGGAQGLQIGGGNLGLQLNDTPNLDNMGGGQGLTISTEDLAKIDPFWGGLPQGTLSEAGLFLESYLPSLGDPRSFINDNSKPVDGAGRIIGGSGSAATGNHAPGTSTGSNKSVADRLKELLKGNGGLNKLAIGALGAYLANKADGDKKSGGWTPPAANLTYNRGTLAQDPGRRPGAANPGGYFTPVTYAAQGGLMRPAHKMKAGGGIEGLLKGQGDGLSDSIPATIDGQEPAQLATDEYVVSADVVAALGGGSADAGARRLDEMMSRVRTQAHGHDRQTRPVSDKALPA